MHRTIADHLELYLSNPASAELPVEFHTHADQCAECRELLARLRQQSDLFQALAAPAEELEVRAGFYARVMDRVEEQSRGSLWSLFVDTTFGRRLAMASFALVLVLGTVLVSTEPGSPIAISDSVAIADEYSPAPVGVSSDPQQERDAVFVNLVTYQQ